MISKIYSSFNKKIFILINPVHGPPSWLNTSHPKIEIVHHHQVLKQVPTNNAWAIQTIRHRIPHLGRWFLALNDDVLLNGPLKLNHKVIQCPNSEVVHPHCPTLLNTCVMYGLEAHFKSRVQNIYNHRKKSTLGYRPDVVLWLEHHNWMVSHHHAKFKPSNKWFGLINTNDWKQESHWVRRRWQQIVSKSEVSTWINAQGQGISWEYPSNPSVHTLFKSWIKRKKWDIDSEYINIPKSISPPESIRESVWLKKTLWKVWAWWSKRKTEK